MVRYRIVQHGEFYKVQWLKHVHILWWTWDAWVTLPVYGEWGDTVCDSIEKARASLARWQASKRRGAPARYWRPVEHAVSGKPERDPDEEWLSQMKGEVAAFEEQCLAAAGDNKQGATNAPT